MRKKLIAITLALVVLTSAGGALAQSQAPDDAGPGNNAPDNAKPFGNTTAITENQTVDNSSELAGKIRIEEQYLNNTTVSLAGNTTGNYTFVVNVTHGDNETVENVTMFVQEQAVESSTGVNLSQVTLEINGNAVDYYDDAGPGNSPWVGFVVPQFTENTITFKAAGTGGDGGSLTDPSTDPLGLPTVGGFGVTYLGLIGGVLLAIGGVAFVVMGDESTEYR